MIVAEKAPIALHDRDVPHFGTAVGVEIVGTGASAVRSRVNAETVWQKVTSGAAENLPDEQLLALILELFLPPPAARAVAAKLLARFGNLCGIVRAEPRQVRDCIAVPASAVGFLKALRSVAERLARSEVSGRPVLDTWEKLIAHLRTTKPEEAAEHLRAIFLDRRNTLIADEILFRGAAVYTDAYPREVVRRALILDASAVITVHGRAGHRLRPTKAAISVTTETQRTLDKIGVVLHDHVIMSDGRPTSLRNMRAL